jgi:sensor histidine kinase YesM
MNFQTQLRKNFMEFSVKLILIVCILFVSIALIVSLISKNIYKNDNIDFLDKTFIELNEQIFLQMESHNSNLEYIDSVQNNSIDKKLVSTTNYTFTRKMDLRFSYNIYDANLDPVYQDSSSSSTLRYKMYLSIIKERIEKDNPIKFIIYSDLESNNSSLIYYSGLYKNNKLIGIDTYLIDINDLSYFLLPNSGNYVITNRFDNVIASNNFEILKAGFNFKYSKNYKLNGVNFKVTRVHKNYYTIYYLEKKFSIEKYYFLVFFMLIGIVFLVIFFSNKVIKRIAEENSRSIESIISDSNVVSLGKLDHKINEELEGDFQNLAKNINEMINKLNSEIKLNKQLSDTNLIFEKRKLDSQFDPHFLYNSLETIRYSMLFDVKGTEKYILELNSILRYSITNKINYSSLHDDLTYIKKYLELFKFRFKDKFTYIIKVSDDMKDILVPKLVIQPLVENCVKYGFNERVKVHIEIIAEMVNDICYIKVYDNGISISDEVIYEIRESIRNEENPTNHIGVHNVLRRFMILYPDSKLTVSRDSDGTVFEISFKKKKNQNV